ncbi:MAG: PrpF family protein, partial [Rhodospirillales bacterium]|nr:PrpF family protein [Rhodospirillales bacterium]
ARSEWDGIFTGAMGSPDPYGRQLNGMGGGISSLSKVCVVGRSDRPDADVDYTFGQVLIGEGRVDYSANCGNMSSAVGPFAVEAGLVEAAGDRATVRIFNTNTGKIIRSIFPIRDGSVVYDGDLEIPGVAGAGAPIQLQFLDPGGASTGRLLPTGRPSEPIATGSGSITGSKVDAANACVFVHAKDIGLSGIESPAELDGRPDILRRLEDIRRHASVVMGVAGTLGEAERISASPSVAFAAPPRDYHSLDGGLVSAASHDFNLRVISNGQPHRATPLTIALCAAVAARIDGSVLAGLMVRGASGSPIRLGTPSGVLTVDATVARDASGTWVASAGTFYRTARRLFEGRVWSVI